ncbi:MAG: plasmid mobilization relaxosome protein MobC [Lachnospiraceae bacterium]|nr:plasmid mobilization relaxosome protein MobC [Lachnospiraceae bacterium]
MKRDVQMHFRVSQEEEKLIREKMKQTGIRSIGVYLRKMSLEGYCIQLDLSDVKEVVRLLRICSNNLNQYAKKANETGSIYQTDIENLKEILEEIWKEMKEILTRLSTIQ